MDPITLEIVRNKLTNIADEMESVLLKAAFSPIVKEGLDASSAIFDIKGQTIAQAAAIPIHLGCLIPAINKIVETWNPYEMSEGDMFILNDPYNGGTHLPDIVLAMPVFYENEPVAIVTTMCHHQDIGGMIPGSLSPEATELFQEGLRLPPLQYMSKGKVIEPIRQILEANVRIPNIVLGDLNAQTAALKIGERRIKELVNDITVNEFRFILEELLDRSEKMTRKRIKEIPDGEYHFSDYLDDDGITPGVRIPIQAKVKIDYDHIEIDFTGSSTQVKGPFNCVPSSTLSAVYYVVRAITGPDIPNNSGCFRSITMILPKGSIVNPDFPAPVNSRTATVKRITDTLFGCFAEAIPEKMPGVSSGQLLVMNFGGVDTLTNKTYITSELGVGGSGGHPMKDGISSIDTDATNCMNIPAEAIEMDAPIRIIKWNLWQDSAGAGLWKGGLGVEKVFEVVRGEATVSYRGERHTTRAWGINGGLAAPNSQALIIRKSGERETIQSKQTLYLKEGDQLQVFISGGGGYGNPLKRPIQFVQEDLENGYISKQSAETQYGVIFNEEGSIDIEKSKTNRGQQLEKIGLDPTFHKGGTL